ncbi:SH3 domain-binding protein 4 [Latimeria chalumnae]|uniref:SH3 domain binding protein 4 n=1 Tax=Latimeria chalumnae TaxID=7897 RepID=H3AIX9_LATCH|nr:PREDICTED: SH3 domain-binding protein 4 [Latimeria chalumnae]|eukprot:XP_005994330.1 PREDICTED: SH3 domain-binding protein 4 [Latimeria chalumnae]
MAAHRIRATTANALPRCKSEGTLIDLSDGFSEPSFSDVQVPSPSALRRDTTTSFGNAREVVAIKDYCPTNFTTLKFSKGDHLYVLDTSGGEWWYAHNTTEMGYIPATYVQPLSHRNSSLSDSGMIDLGDGADEGAKELDLLGEWEGVKNQSAKTYQNNPFLNGGSTNPFLNGGPHMPLSLSSEKPSKASMELQLLDTFAPSLTGSSSATTNGIFDDYPSNNRVEFEHAVRRDNPFFRSKRSYSLSELSVLQAKSDKPASSGFFTGLKSPSPEQFQSREDFRAAWLNHRKLARSCHDLDLLGQNPGWGQTQPVETNIVCKLDSSGGAVQLPDTNISIHVPEGHVSPGDTQQISMKALLDPPLELNGDKSTTICPVVEIKLSNMEVKTFITLEIKLSAEVMKDETSRNIARIGCLRSDSKDGPYSPVPKAYHHGDTVQLQLDNLEPCMYVVVVAQANNLLYPSTVWEYIDKKITVGVYGPKHIHPSFKTVVAAFGHDCAPKTLLVNEVGRHVNSVAPVALQLWGKHQFSLQRPQDLKIGMYSNMSNYEVKTNEHAKVVRGFQVKLGKVSHLIFPINSHNKDELSDFTLRVQVKDAGEGILSQFCVQTPQPLPKSSLKPGGQRRFLKKNEVGKIILSPLAATSKYPTFQERAVTNLRYGKLLKTVVRQTKNQYLLEYKKGDPIALLSEEKVKLRGQLWTKEWYIGYYQGKIGLVHAKNVLVVGKIKPSFFSGPDLATSALLDQILRPCKFLTYIYASVRTLLMENVYSWRAFADALGYVNLPLSHFCRVDPDSEPERVASVLEKLKEDCNSMENMERKSFQKELMHALLKIDCQGLVARLIQDFVLLTTAVEVAQRWRELAEKLAKVSKQQVDAYEAPHRNKNGVLDTEAMWKPAYDFLLTWSAQMGESYRDVLQELHLGLDKMKSPITKNWKHLTGALILVNSLELLRAAAFCPVDHDDLAI